MSTEKPKPKVKIKRPEVRSVKVQSRFRSSEYSECKVPEIRISGYWLEKLGFLEGKRLTIITMNGMLIIQTMEEAP